MKQQHILFTLVLATVAIVATGCKPELPPPGGTTSESQLPSESASTSVPKELSDLKQAHQKVLADLKTCQKKVKVEATRPSVQEQSATFTLEMIEECLAFKCELGDEHDGTNLVDLFQRDVKLWEYCTEYMQDYDSTSFLPDGVVLSQELPTTEAVKEQYTCFERNVFMRGIALAGHGDLRLRPNIERLYRSFSLPQVAYALLVWDHVGYLDLGKERVTVAKDLREQTRKLLRLCLSGKGPKTCNRDLCKLVEHFKSPEEMIFEDWSLLQGDDQFEQFMDFTNPTLSGMGLTFHQGPDDDVTGSDFPKSEYLHCLYSNETEADYIGFAK